MTLRAGTRSLGRMNALTLVIGSRNYSSWSLRPWLLLRHLGLEFEERQFHLDTPEFDEEIAKISPTRRVPVLIHGELVDRSHSRSVRARDCPGQQHGSASPGSRWSC